MVSCKLMGGLSNQMFQIATTHALALRNNDVSGFDFDHCYTPNQGYTAHKYKDTIFKNVNKIKLPSNFMNDLMYDNLYKLYNEPKFSHTDIPYVKDMFLVGYFQSPKYFDDYAKQIKELFSIPDDIKEEANKIITEIGASKITSIHVRRGDYLSHPTFHPVCPIEYYKQAMHVIGGVFIVMSDDMDWCEKNFKGDHVYFSPFNEEIYDLALMTLCNNNIIANSSFSWWGAYLNDNPSKKVIAPRQWFGSEGPKDQQDIVPENWFRL